MYDVGKDKLPSVTTILAATQSQEKQASLAAWRFKLKDRFITLPDGTLINDSGIHGPMRRQREVLLCILY
jgi:hypothetical protein